MSLLGELLSKQNNHALTIVKEKQNTGSGFHDPPAVHPIGRWTRFSDPRGIGLHFDEMRNFESMIDDGPPDINNAAPGVCETERGRTYDKNLSTYTTLL